MDDALGRLVAAFEQQAPGPVAIVVVGDHGEGLGDHGEAQHGNLIYQSTMRVPLLVVGPGVAGGRERHPGQHAPRLPHGARLGGPRLRRQPARSGSAARPRRGDEALSRLRVAAAGDGRGGTTARRSRPGGSRSTTWWPIRPRGTTSLPARACRARCARPFATIPLPSLGPPKARDALGEEERRKLASLGYVSAGAAPVVRKDAPRPVDMARLFDVIEKASFLFVREEYARAIPLFERILAEDRHNLDAALRLATAHSALGHEQQALAAFDKANDIAPGSPDVRTYLALHYARGSQWPRAVPLLEQVVAESPDRLPALEAPGRRARETGTDPGRDRPAPEDLRHADAHARRARPARRAGHGSRADGPRHRVVREGAGPRRARPSGGISSSECSTSPRGASRRPATLSTGCRPPTRPIRWRSSSGPR